MNILNPPALLLCLLALPILLLYMLKLRRREVDVSSTLLWQLILHDRQANTPWQRLRRNLLLILQLLILAALVLALVRPVQPVASIVSGSSIVLLDASASMSSTDVSPSRFEAARQVAQRMISNLNDHETMTLILVANQPLVLASSEQDKNRLQSALQSASVTYGPANWDASFALAAGAATQAARASGIRGQYTSTIVILSDGGLPEYELPGLPGEVRYIPIGESGENLAISALAMRSTGNNVQLFASLTNYSTLNRTVIFSLFLADELLDAQQIHLLAGQQTSIVFGDLPKTQSIYRARISDPEQPDSPVDKLSLDDTAFAVNQPQRTGRTLVASPGNFFLEQVLTALPGITPYRAISDQNRNLLLPEDQFDLIVYDGFLPPVEELPLSNMLLINPPANPFFSVTGSFTNTKYLQSEAHPLSAYVDWSNIHISQAVKIDIPLWAEPVIQSEGGPLVFAGETGGRRIAVITFDLHNSDLPLQVAFPILFANLTNYLLPSQPFNASQGLQPGDSLSILPSPGVSALAITSPSGKAHTYMASENGILFSETDELGVYAVNYQGDPDQDVDYFAVNLFDEVESNIQPKVSIQFGRRSVAASVQDQISKRELWPWLGTCALAILLLEWWVYHSRLQAAGSSRSRWVKNG